MAKILTPEEDAAISVRRQRERQLDVQGWDVEGADDQQNKFFNNRLGQMFYADYYGNITESDAGMTFTRDMLEFIRLEGEISQIVELGIIPEFQQIR